MTDDNPPGADTKTAFAAVDRQPEPARMVAAMDATAQWPAVRALRAWERERLALEPGQHVLDVGCGTGDVALALAADVAPGGRVVGIDASEAMLAAAGQRAAEIGVDVQFGPGDATALSHDDASFDAVRTERTLQWIPDVEGAVAEIVRVTRPGGRVSLIDTDWRTLQVDLPDHALATTVLAAILQLRGPSTAVGGRLLNLCRDSGLTDIEGTCATHVWTEWNPAADTAPSGLFPFAMVVGHLAEAGVLDADVGERFLEQVIDAARRDRLYISVTLVAVTGKRPR